MITFRLQPANAVGTAHVCSAFTHFSYSCMFAQAVELEQNSTNEQSMKHILGGEVVPDKILMNSFIGGGSQF